jgi:phospholipid/cholesterol/gamma-HCH transport system permease protein
LPSEFARNGLAPRVQWICVNDMHRATTDVAADGPAFTVQRIEREPGTTALRYDGSLTLDDARSLWTMTRDAIKEAHGKVTLDLSNVEHIDGGALALLVFFKTELESRGVSAELAYRDQGMAELVHLYQGDVRLERPKRRRAEPILAQVGRSTVAVIQEIKEVLAFVGRLTIESLGVLRDPRTANFRDVIPTMERTGADAIPIVVLITFLIGFVTAFQAAVQLKQFGANIFAADLVGLAITRELGPLMTAIIVAGRSGAAFAAELGTMKVSEEVDALSVLGLGPLRHLVLPRLIGLVLVMPMLTLVADIVGVVGGLVVGITSLDLTFTAYMNETKSAVDLWDLSSGLLKSATFGIAIALIGCQQGLATAGGAEGVGRRTTSSVVTMLFALIVIDAAFTIVFHVFGL